MTVNQLADYTKAVCEIARRAGAYIRDERRKFSLGSVERKHAHDYVSYVDKGSEQIIVQALSRLIPEAGFITEEGLAGHADEQLLWVVDPLDGTTNFIHQYAPYAVSIALLQGSCVLLGVVYEVCADECFYAWQDGGAWREAGSLSMPRHEGDAPRPERLHVSRQPLTDALLCLQLPYNSQAYKPMAKHLLDTFYGRAASIRMNGSAAMSLCYVAAGRLDGYAEQYLEQWDFMAGARIVMEAGGRVSDFSGSDVFAHGNSVVATNGLVHEPILEAIGQQSQPETAPKPEGPASIPSSRLLSLLLVMLTVVLAACHNRPAGLQQPLRADSLIDAAVAARDFDRLQVLADSLEERSDISQMEADFWRGRACHKKRLLDEAKGWYTRVLDVVPQTADEEDTYLRAAGYLADLLYIKHDYEGALHVAVPIIQQMESRGVANADAMILLLSSVGRCQMKLNRQEEAAQTFNKLYLYNVQRIDQDTTSASLRDAVVHTGNVAIRYLNARLLDDALPWIDRTEAILNQYAATPDAGQRFVEEYRARLSIYRAFVLEHLGRSDEASRSYSRFMTSDYAQTDDGRSDACEYLIAAKRYDEAADNLMELDRMMDQWGYKLTLDNIQSYLLPKYRANLGAGRRDSALATAMQICEAIDSALEWQRSDEAAELATVYDTQQKEMTIARQQADLSQQRMVAVVVALGLLGLFFIFYIVNSRRVNRRLAEKNQLLETANAQARESSKMKTDFIQQISHEIRTPLNILSGFTQVITTPGMTLDEATRADINRQITENTDRITGLVNKMLELSDASSTTVIERSEQVLAVQVALQAIEDAGIERLQHVDFKLKIDASAEALQIKTGLTAAARALALLLDNAGKFTKPAEALAAVAKTALGTPDRKPAKQRVTLTVDTRDGLVHFVIEDTGIGIPTVEAEHIFDEFVQLDEYYDGTGIGLTVARSLCRRLGGDIVLDTTYTQGARFVMMLPA